MKRHFVTFYSPGTFVAEQSEYPIEKWDVDKAVALARTVKERYNATPYGFRFSTRSRGEKDLDSKITRTSGMYYLGGVVETAKDIEKRGDPKEETLLQNMKCNGWKRVITNTNSWRWAQPFYDEDVLLEFKP